MTEKVGKIEVVIKGGQPWGFRLQSNLENRSTLTIIEIIPGGKADLQGELKVGDNVIKVNGIQCLSLEDALQLIDSAFRTLTVLVWRHSQCSEDVSFMNDKALKPCSRKFNELSSLPTESYPASFHIYENLQDISQRKIQNCTKTFSTQINTTYCKNMFTPLPNAGSKNANAVLKGTKKTSEYYAQQLISSNLYFKADFDAKCEKETYANAKWKSLSRSKEIQHNSNLSSHHVPTNVKGDCHNSYKENYVPTVEFQENDYKSQSSSTKHFLGSSLKNNLGNRKVSAETQGCMYPNCQNQYQTCKIHSPPERDITNPVCNPYKLIAKNQFAHQSLSHPALKCDEIKYENLELLSSSQESSDIKNMKSISWMNAHSVSEIPLSSNHSELELKDRNICISNSAFASNLNSDNLIKYENLELLSSPLESTGIKESKTMWVNEHSTPKIPLSSNNSETELKEKNIYFSNPTYGSHLNSDNLIKYENQELLSSSQESTDTKNIKSICMNKHSGSKIPLSIHSEADLSEKNVYFFNPTYGSLTSDNLKDVNLPNNFSRVVNYENVPNKDIHLLSPTRTSVHDMHQDEIFDQPNFTSSNSNVKGLINSTLFMLCNKSSINSAILTNSNGICSGSAQNNTDEELIEFEKKYENSMYLSNCQTPPLPSPPPEFETEILESDEPLPPPPPSFPSINIEPIVQDDTKIVQTIYANLEMLEIQCSVVSSATQTTLQLNKNTTVKDFSDLRVEIPVQKFSQYAKDPLPQVQLQSNSERSVQTQFQNYSSLMRRTVYDQEKKLNKNSLNLPKTSAYFTTSVPKAKLLTQYTSKFEHKNLTFVKELSNEKEALLESIAKKLRILKHEKAAIQEEVKQNEELGSNLATKMEKLANKSENQKFKLHVEELEKITNLLLSLSGRLARTENALLILPAESTEEKELLEAKYCKLNQQYDEAVHLQRNIEKRNNHVSIFLHKYLTHDELVDYEHFIHMKVKLLVDYKDLLEKIKLGEEQLYALKSSFCANNGNEIKRDLCNNIYVL